MKPDGRSKSSAENGKKGGRPKGYSAIQAEKSREMICEKLEKEFAPIVVKAIQQAKAGDKYAREWVTDRAYGKAIQSIDLRGKDGKPLFDEETRKKAKETLGALLGGVVGEGGGK